MQEVAAFFKMMYTMLMHWGRVYVWEEFWNLRLLYDRKYYCAQMTLYGWQNVKIQLLTGQEWQYYEPVDSLYLSFCSRQERQNY